MINDFEAVKKIQLTPHFRVGEFVKGWVHPAIQAEQSWAWDRMRLIANRLEAIRDNATGPIRITSYWRSSTHNKLIGGAKLSDHLEGLAVDFQMEKISSGFTACRYAAYRLNEMGAPWDQIIGYKSHVHLSVAAKARREVFEHR